MRWFKHDTNSRNDTKLKLLKKKFGALGYGIYFQLLEIIGENIKENNYEEWGFVESIHSLDTLADECGVSRDKLTTVLKYCNEIGLLYKLDNKMCCPKILLRLDEYATRRKKDFDVLQREKDLTTQCRDSIGIVSGEDRVLEENRTEENRREERKEHSLSYLLNIPTEDITEFTTRFNVTERQIRSKGEDLHNYCVGHGKKYANYKSMFINALKKDFKPRVLLTTPPKIDIPDAIDPQRMQEIRNKAYSSIGTYTGGTV